MQTSQQISIIEESLDQLILEGMKNQGLFQQTQQEFQNQKNSLTETNPKPEIVQGVMELLYSPSMGLKLKLELPKRTKRKRYFHSQNFMFCGFSDKILVTAKRKNAKQTQYDKYMSCFRFQM